MSATSFQSPFCFGLRLSRTSIPAFTTPLCARSAMVTHHAVFFPPPPPSPPIGGSVGRRFWQRKEDLRLGTAALRRRLKAWERCGAVVVVREAIAWMLRS